MGQQYLIVSPDGARVHLRVTDRAGVERMLAEDTAFVADGGWEKRFLDRIPAGEAGHINPGQWGEQDQLILKVEVVVPEPVTMKWMLP